MKFVPAPDIAPERAVETEQEGRREISEGRLESRGNWHYYFLYPQEGNQ